MKIYRRLSSNGITHFIVFSVIVALVFFMPITATFLSAQEAESSESGAQELPPEIKNLGWQEGPQMAKMEGIAEIRVPANYVFLDGDDTRKLMNFMGNISTNTEVGLLAPDDLNWFIVFEYDDIGYIKDDEKDNLDANAIMESMQKGNVRGNKERKKLGYPALYIEGWETEPKYNEETHNLEWATRLRAENGENSINHNVRVLGRKGVMRVTLVSSPQDFQAVLPDFDQCMEEYAFQSGHKYAEYRSGDKVAKYGLTALVVGGAAALAVKSGLLKHLWKLLVLIGGGIVAFFKKLFGKKE